MPWDWLGGQVAEAATNIWINVMMSLWNAGMWFLKLILHVIDTFTTPDLSGNGPINAAYSYSLWISLSLMGILTMIQLGVAAVRRDGKSLATLLIGTGQFALVYVCWLGVAAVILKAAGGLTDAMMSAYLSGAPTDWGNWHVSALDHVSASHVTDAAVATVMGLMGLLLWMASLIHLLMMIVRAGALLLLTVTAPISAAGLVANVGKDWFWKTLRWFVAAAFAPVIVAMVMGIGIKMAEGVATGLTDSTAVALGTAVPAVVMILIASFCPLMLFKLLAFVEPGTVSGAAMRAGLDAQGGVGGLLSRGGDSGSAAASSEGSDGRSAGESSAEEQTMNRHNSGSTGSSSSAGSDSGNKLTAGISKALPVVGGAFGLMQTVGTRGASIAADTTNQMGTGHNTYYPDFSGTGSKSRGGSGGSGGSSDRGALNPAAIHPPTPGMPTSPDQQSGPIGDNGPGGGAEGAGAAEGGEAAMVAL